MPGMLYLEEMFNLQLPYPASSRLKPYNYVHMDNVPETQHTTAFLPRTKAAVSEANE